MLNCTADIRPWQTSQDCALSSNIRQAEIYDAGDMFNGTGEFKEALQSYPLQFSVGARILDSRRFDWHGHWESRVVDTLTSRP